MSLLQRFLRNEYSALMLAPVNAAPHRPFGQVKFDSWYHQLILRDIQQLRARSYLHRNLIAPDDLTREKTYPTRFDPNSWHFVIFKRGNLVGFIKNRIYYNGVPGTALKTFDSINRLQGDQKAVYSEALTDFIQSSLLSFPRFGESSSWITAPEASLSAIGMILVLSTFAFYALQGHAKGLAVTRADNGASKILAEICGIPLVYNGKDLPTYYDPFYKAQQRILTFDTRQISAKFCNDIQQIRDYLSTITVNYPITSLTASNPLSLGKLY